jgi:hypothetical protein
MEEHILIKWLTDRGIADLFYTVNFFTSECSCKEDRKISCINYIKLILTCWSDCSVEMWNLMIIGIEEN